MPPRRARLLGVDWGQSCKMALWAPLLGDRLP